MKKEIKKPKLLVLIISLIIILALTQLIISHRLATAGGEMRQWEEKVAYLEEQNRILSEEINHMGSLSRIATKAQEMGLVKASAVLYLKPQIPVAWETSEANLER